MAAASPAPAPAATSPSALEYPPAEATHEQVVADKELFQGALTRLLAYLGIKLKMPKVGGAEVDLHLLYKEVTGLGGLDVVTHRKQWVLVCEPFNFPASFTNKSYVIKKLYVNALHHFEQVYFHGRQGALVPLPMIAPSAAAAAAAAAAVAAAAVASMPPSPKRRRLARSESAVVLNSSEPVVVVPDGPSSNSASTSSAFKGLEAGTQFTGVIDDAIPNGYRITLHLPEQVLHGVLYRQPPELGMQAAGHVQPGGKTPTAVAVQTDEDTAVSQELESRHELPSIGAPLMGVQPLTPPAMTPIPPRPARTPFQFFQLGVNRDQVGLLGFVCYRNQVLKLHPALAALRPSDVVPKIMSELWHQMTKEQHKPFINMAMRDKARYEQEFEMYNRWLMDMGLPPAEGYEGEIRTPPMTPHLGSASRRRATSSVMETQGLPHYHVPHPHHPHRLLPPPGHVGTPPAHPRRLCMGIPIGSPHRAYPPLPQHLLPHQLKVRVQPHSARYPSAPPGHRHHALPPGAPALPSGPDFELLPPDMDPEDLDHLCHYTQDDKPFPLHYEHGGGAAGGAPLPQGYAHPDSLRHVVAELGVGAHQLPGMQGRPSGALPHPHGEAFAGAMDAMHHGGSGGGSTNGGRDTSPAVSAPAANAALAAN